MIGKVKSREELLKIAFHYNKGQCLIMKGTSFPEHNFKYCGQTFDFESTYGKDTFNPNNLVYHVIIDGEYRFFSIDAIDFVQ